jgi:hypothetical protein
VIAVGLRHVERSVEAYLNGISLRIAEVDGKCVAVVHGEELACAKFRSGSAGFNANRQLSEL